MDKKALESAEHHLAHAIIALENVKLHGSATIVRNTLQQVREKIKLNGSNPAERNGK